MHLPHFRVFLSSPGDVGDERALARMLIEQLGFDPFLRNRATLELVAWDTLGGGSPVLADRTPQASIDRGLARPSDCDIVVAVFWSRIGTRLPTPQYARADGTAFESGSVWELEDALGSSRATGRPYVVVYRRLPPAPLDPSAADVVDRLEQFRGVEKLFAGFRDPATGVIASGYTKYERPDEFRKHLDHDLRSLLVTLLETAAPVSLPAATAAPPAPSLWKGSPFPGLRSFTPVDAPIYFGRGRETDLLTEKTNDHSFVAVVGASGSGKSSLVGAGLIPRLAESQRDGASRWELPTFDATSQQWIGLRMTPGELGPDPLMPLAVRLVVGGRVPPREIADRLAHAPEEVVGLVDKLVARPEARTLVFIDQFEELFTIVSDEHRDPFVAVLTALAASDRHHVVVTMRSDYFQRGVELPALARLLEGGNLPVAAPTDTLLEMISRPAGFAGLEFEEGLAGRILQDAGAGAGALPLLAFTLDELYRVSDGIMSHDAYERLGGVQGAIGVRAEETFRRVAGGGDAFDTIFRELVEIGDDGLPSRRRVRRTVIVRDQLASAIVDAFVDARLLVSASDDAGDGTIEIAHESLFNSWPRLRELITLQREDLLALRQVRRAAHEWAGSGRDKAYLWPDERLEPVYAVVDRLHPSLDEPTTEFLRPEHERLVESLHDRSTPSYQRTAAADRLAAIGPKTVECVAALLTDSEADVRAAAVHALQRIGEPSVPFAAAVIRGAPSADARLDALSILRHVATPAAVDAIAAAVDDADQRVRSAAIGALGALGGPVAEEALLGALDDDTLDLRWRSAGLLAAFGSPAIPGLIGALSGTDPEARSAARSALSALGAVAVPALIEQLSTAPTPQEREAAAFALVEMPSPARPLLNGTPSSPDPDVEWRIVSILGMIGDRGSASRVALALRSRDPLVRATALGVLRAIGGTESVDEVMAFIDDHDPDMCDEAARTLASLGPEAIEPLLSVLLSTRSDRARATCVRALAAAARTDDGVVRRLIGALDDSTSAHAERALAAVGEPAIEALVDALAADAIATARAASRVLTSIGPAVVEALARQLTKPEWPGAGHALEVLARFAGPDLVMLFVERLGDPDPELRGHAVEGLSRMGREALPLLMSRLISPEPLVRASVHDALAQIGGPAVRPLIERFRTATAAERDAAAKVLAQIDTPAAVFTSYHDAWARDVAVVTR